MAQKLSPLNTPPGQGKSASIVEQAGQVAEAASLASRFDKNLSLGDVAPAPKGFPSGSEMAKIPVPEGFGPLLDDYPQSPEIVQQAKFKP